MRRVGVVIALLSAEPASGSGDRAMISCTGCLHGRSLAPFDVDKSREISSQTGFLSAPLSRRRRKLLPSFVAIELRDATRSREMRRNRITTVDQQP